VIVRPLEGVRILDLTRLLPGALCTLMLADLGAEVIKIEAPDGGDYARTMPPLIDGVGAFFRVANRSKRSVVINLKEARGQAVLARLAEQADVLVESFRPGVLARLNCGADDLRGRNPRLIYCAISSWGQDGPYAERSGHDLNYAALAGLVGAMPRPAPLGGQAADLSGAYAALSAIMAALLRRERAGVGAVIDTALFESALPLTLVGWLESVYGPAASMLPGTLTGRYACYHVYTAADGAAVALAALEPKFWANFCRAVERPDLAALDHLQPDLQPTLTADLAAIFASRPAAAWDALLGEVDCCFTRVTPPAQIHDDPQVRARGSLGMDDEGPWLRSPLRLDQVEAARGTAPGLGEHTRAVLREVGFPDDEIDLLVTQGVLGGE
jgi:crotonobetainyl-CoA:carnitine CoA-transferase CaiB-like acyl-CoA transferase